MNGPDTRVMPGAGPTEDNESDTEEAPPSFDGWDEAVDALDDQDARTVRALGDLRQFSLGDFAREGDPIPVADGGWNDVDSCPTCGSALEGEADLPTECGTCGDFIPEIATDGGADPRDVPSTCDAGEDCETAPTHRYKHVLPTSTEFDQETRVKFYCPDHADGLRGAERLVACDGGAFHQDAELKRAGSVPDSASARATYRNGSGYSTVYVESYSVRDGHIIATDVDGRTHQWAPGADVHVVEVSP